MDDTAPEGLSTSQGAPRRVRATLDPNATRALPTRQRPFADEIRYADSGVAPEEGALAESDSLAGQPVRERCPVEHGPLPGSDAIRLEIAHEGWFGGHELPLGLGELAERRPAAQYPLAYPLAAPADEPTADDGYPGVTGYAPGDPWAGYEEVAAERSFTRLYARPWANPGRSWPVG